MQLLSSLASCDFLELNTALTISKLQFPVPVLEALHDSSFLRKSQYLNCYPCATWNEGHVQHKTFPPILGLSMSTSGQAVTG